MTRNRRVSSTEAGSSVKADRNTCVELFAKNVTDKLADLDEQKDLYHFWVDRKTYRACFGLTFNDRWSKKYSTLNDLTPERFSSMVDSLLNFQRHQQATALNEPSILSYHLGSWKTVESFHIKLHPTSLQEFRSTILYYSSDEIAQILMSDPKMHTEYDRFKGKLDFIKNNSIFDDAFFRVERCTSGEQPCDLYISRKTHSIVAMDAIDMRRFKHPYHEAYRYASILEKFFAKKVEGVNFGIDHCSMKLWVWGDFDERKFEAEILHPRQIVKTGEFQQYLPYKLPEPKPEGCKGIYVGNLDYRVRESDLRGIFNKCGTIDKICIPRDEGNCKGFAFIYFVDTADVDKAMEQGDQSLLGRKLHLSYMRDKQRRSDHREVRRFTGYSDKF